MVDTEQENQTELEGKLLTVGGVVGAVVVGLSGEQPQVHVFCRAGAAGLSLRAELERILEETASKDLAERLVVHELLSDSSRGEAGRPLITSVVVQDKGESSEAHINLVLGDTESVGRGQGGQTEYDLRVVAATALEAAQAFLEGPGTFELQGVSLIEALQQKIVLVLVRSGLAGGGLTLGASLVGEGPIHVATVKAALDAVNRQLGQALNS